MEQTIPTNMGDLSVSQIFDHLAYASYKVNRKDVSAERLAKWYAHADELEKRYQSELQEAKENQAVAICRGCLQVLKGKPYYMGGDAYHPRTNERCKFNFYGGFVCSEQCDFNASLELERSMPGHTAS